MSIKEQLSQQKDRLAHAYLLLGPKERVRKGLDAFITDELGITLAGNPDLRQISSHNLSITDARQIGDWVSKKPVQESRTIIIIEFETASQDAQNALLKSIEDPTAQVMIFFVCSGDQYILPTIKSRVVSIQEETAEQEGQHDLGTFFALDFPERWKYMETHVLIKDAETVENKIRTKAFVNEILDFVFQNDSLENWTATYRSIEKMAAYIHSPSASLKYILEFCCVSIPKQ